MIWLGSKESSVSCSPTHAYSVLTLLSSTACIPDTPDPGPAHTDNQLSSYTRAVNEVSWNFHSIRRKWVWLVGSLNSPCLNAYFVSLSVLIEIYAFKKENIVKSSRKFIVGWRPTPNNTQYYFVRSLSPLELHCIGYCASNLVLDTRLK